MLKSLRKYANPEHQVIGPTEQTEGAVPSIMRHGVPIIWQTGNIDQIMSLLVLREAELVVAKAQLTRNERIDWYAKNRILDFEIKVADLKKWLAEAMAKQSGA